MLAGSSTSSAHVRPDSDLAQLRRDDAELARLARSEAQLRLRIGEALDALFRVGGHHELGFASLELYGLERTHRSKRWCGDTRRLAHRLAKGGLGAIRNAMLDGRLSWSMAELLARHATAVDEAALVEEAQRSTIRQMRKRLSEGRDDDQPEDELVRATRSAGGAEVVMVETTRMLVDYLDGKKPTDEALLTAMLGEGETTLYALLESSGQQVPLPNPSLEALRARLNAERRARAEQQRDAPAPPAPPVVVEVAEDLPLPRDVRALDAEIRRCVRILATRDLRMGELAHRLVERRGWQRLGYASREQYADVRIGVSLSKLEHRAILFARARRSVELREALEQGEIGLEAAYQISGFVDAGPEVVSLWIARARRRTFVHLKEELEGVKMRRSLNPSAALGPPDEAALEEIAEIRRRVQSGEIFRSLLDRLPGPQMSVTVRGGDGREVSAPRPGRAAHALRRGRGAVPPHRRPEALLHRVPVSLPLADLGALRGAHGRQVGGRPSSRPARMHEPSLRSARRHAAPPALSRARRWDEMENLASLCAWCHLEGIHGGRLKASPPASHVHWTVGRQPLLEVDGRDVVARAS